MASDLSQLESRYLEECGKQEVLPNPSILLSFSNVKRQKAHFEQCCLEIFIDHLTFADIPLLIETLSETCLSDIDAIDITQKSSNVSLNGECLLLLLGAVNQKLRIVDLSSSSLREDVLCDIFQKGTSCQILNLRYSPIQKLNITGEFMYLNSLNLDFSVHLTSFHINCFSCMPKLMQLSMCETRVANLWMASAALSKLTSLAELRFQNCLCCYDTGPCPKLGAIGKGFQKSCTNKQPFTSSGSQSVANKKNLEQNIKHFTNARFVSFCSETISLINHDLLESTSEILSDDSDPEFPTAAQGIHTLRNISDTFPQIDGQNNSNILVRPFKHSRSSCVLSVNSSSFTENATADEFCCQLNQNDNLPVSDVLSKDEGSSNNMINLGSTTRTSLKNHISSHPSPICFEKHYREYMITSLPHLKVLDNLPIEKLERDKAALIFKRYFESAPYNRQCDDSVVSILQRREISRGALTQKSSKVKRPYLRESNHSFPRSLSSVKLISSPQPHLHSVSKFKCSSNEEIKSFRARQFEYHPTDPILMVFGTLDGELIVINHECEKLIGYLPSVGALNSILGLCWLKKHPSKLIAGSDNGSLQMYDVGQMPSKVTERYCAMDASMTFDDFEQLTSVHINSNDEYFLASGFSNHVALYDIGCGRRLQIFRDLHKEHINVVKFSHHSPTVFATASFDKDVKLWDLRQGTSQPCYTASSSRGNVMVCFSPDDNYLLTSAIDNEVKQLLAVDGRLQTSFDIASTGSSQNYTRSYYMNGRDYIITGSCEEHVVRICCAQTGRRLKDVHLEVISY
ncbi:hypothetical protein Cni_G06535 [Canna indica]|uniref:U2A'/phosphoprotein 32 family A C-terminal domain-containing protein n=1 Tax=Canna indica TaxID=4628 RepID=A0AAQ3JX88_9LILI|nr:hypothetical protein Cni_G06535 [Canna indica]